MLNMGKILNKLKVIWKRVILVIFITFLAVFSLTAYYLYTLVQPPIVNNNIVNVEIPHGATTVDIAKILSDKELIKNELLFRLFVRLQEQDGKMQAGKYEIKTGTTIPDIITMLTNGEGNVSYEVVRFTIPEGWKIEEIANYLAEKRLVDKKRFLELVDKGNFTFSFNKYLPEKTVGHRLEGFLFPDTYEIKKGAKEEEIIQMMLNQFAKKWEDDWFNEIEKRNMTPYDAVILASIIEREVVVDKERPLVAGVFYNRLQKKWKLESCATVQFLLGKQKADLTLADLKIDNPYNTYLYAGLPPGPISNPGYASLKAAVNPAKHDYFFFVTKKDGSNEHLFAKTFAEHLRNDAKSQGNW